MPYVRSKADRGKALVLVVAVHAALALAVLSGPGRPALEQAVEQFRTFDVRQEAPPPPPPPDPATAAAAPDEAAAPGLRAEPSPVVVPPSPVRLPVPSPVATSEQAAPTEGSNRTAGASDQPGSGTGANGSVSGFGGGGSGGTGAGGLGAEARLLSGNLSRRDYRRIRSFGAPRGQAVLAITVGPEGRLTSCASFTGSGNPELDNELCALLARTRWSPALDRRGEPVSVALRYVATWDRD